MNPQFSLYRNRRDQILRRIGSDGIAVLFAAPEQRRSNDTFYPYRQDSYFYYLSGFTEPEAALVLDGKSGQTYLFCREKHPEREIWDGFRWGPEAAAPEFGFDAAFAISDLAEKLKEFLPGHKRLFHLWALYPDKDAELLRIWQTVQQAAGQRASLSALLAPDTLGDLSRELNAMRLIKDAHEQDLLRRAGHISALGHRHIMQTLKPGMNEFAIEAELLHQFMQNGARSVSYNSIVAGGKNACCLHYVENKDTLSAGQLLLIDAGCEYEYYAGDITRTVPVNGRFEGPARDVYQIVLDVNEEAIAAIRPGADWIDISNRAIARLTQGLLDLKLLSGSLETNIDTKAYRRFYMHGLGHWIGLDVHDVGGRFNDDGTPLLLAPGMCTTIEPGLYIAAAADIPEHFHNIGIRIEDNILVTPDGAEVYTQAVPKSIAEIEALMAA